MRFSERSNLVDSSEDLSGIFGGGSDCTDTKGKTMNQIRQDINQYLTDQDKRNLVRGMEDRVSPTADAMAYFAIGEHDCKHKNVSDRHKRFLRELAQLIAQRKQEAQEENNNTTTTSDGSNTPAKTTGTQQLSTITAGPNGELLAYGIGGLLLAGAGYYGIKKINEATK